MQSLAQQQIYPTKIWTEKQNILQSAPPNDVAAILDDLITAQLETVKLWCVQNVFGGNEKVATTNLSDG